MPIASTPDHVAIAVPDYDLADERWRDQLGGRWVRWFHNHGIFRGRQLRFANGGKLEILQPSEVPNPQRDFLRPFLERFGAQVHHLTLRVDDLAAAIDELRDSDLDVVDVDDRHPVWKEGFLRPSQIGGLVVQIAQTTMSDADWAASHDFEPEPPVPGGPGLLGPLLRHHDLEDAAEVWQLLGAAVSRDADGSLRCRWGDSPLSVRVEHGPQDGPVGLRMTGTHDLDRDDKLGAAVIGAA